MRGVPRGNAFCLDCQTAGRRCLTCEVAASLLKSQRVVRQNALGDQARVQREWEGRP